jgi:hypothetical protein
MIRTDLKLEITRNKKSYDYKFNLKEPDSFKNNIKNNCIDSYKLFKNNQVILEYNELQTVANYPDAHINDTIAPGNFYFVAFVPAGKSFADPKDINRIVLHGLIHATDKENQSIDVNSMQMDQGKIKGRWLIHSTFYPPIAKDTENAFSEGCFIHKRTSDLERLNNILKENGVEKNDWIPVTLTEI